MYGAGGRRLSSMGSSRLPPLMREVLGDDVLWAEIREFLARDFAERDGEMLAAQWQACLDYDSSMRLPTCDVPIHVLAFSEDVQTPPARAREVAELAKTATFHLLEGLCHRSAFGHRPEAVNSCIAEILSQYEDTTGQPACSHITRRA